MCNSTSDQHLHLLFQNMMAALYVWSEKAANNNHMRGWKGWFARLLRVPLQPMAWRNLGQTKWMWWKQ